MSIGKENIEKGDSLRFGKWLHLRRKAFRSSDIDQADKIVKVELGMEANESPLETVKERDLRWVTSEVINFKR